MKHSPADQTTLIVHPGTGTILCADECVIYNTDDTGIEMEEHEIVEEAEANGDTLDGLHVVLVGNIFDGTTIIGPFLSFEDANLWADGLGVGEEWWITAITGVV
jgi:hypothetical protein